MNRDPIVNCSTGKYAVIGGWASAIVLWGFAAYRFNASPYAVSVTIVCWAAPPALLSPVLGVYIDRIGPKAAVVAGYCAAALAAIGMAAAGSLAELALAWEIRRGLARLALGRRLPCCQVSWVVE